MKVIITGATGMVGEGVMLECLENTLVDEVLLIGRNHYDLSHPKLNELIVKDFSEINNYTEQLKDFNGCFFCAGVSSVGETEENFTKMTYDFVVPFANTLSKLNPMMTFIYVSGSRTDSTEQGNVMWARVKGKTENALMKLPFKAEYNFRPGLMRPMKGQKNVRFIYRVVDIFSPLWYLIAPNFICTLKEVGQAMIQCVKVGYEKPILEVMDIKVQAKNFKH